MSENFDIEEQLREHLLDGSEPTPPDLFGRIEAQIQGKERRKKRFFIWFWFGAGLAIITAGILFATNDGNEGNNNRTAFNDNADLQDNNEVIIIESASEINEIYEGTRVEDETIQNQDSLNRISSIIPNPVVDNSSNTDLYQSGGIDANKANETATSGINNTPSIDTPRANYKTIAVISNPDLLTQQEVNDLPQKDINLNAAGQDHPASQNTITKDEEAIGKPSSTNKSTDAIDAPDLLADHSVNSLSHSEGNQNILAQGALAKEQVVADNPSTVDESRDITDSPNLLTERGPNETLQDKANRNTLGQNEPTNEQATANNPSTVDETKDVIDSPKLVTEQSLNKTLPNEGNGKTLAQDQPANNNATDDQIANDANVPDVLLDALDFDTTRLKTPTENSIKDTARVVDNATIDTTSIYPEIGGILRDSVPSIDSTSTPDFNSKKSPFGLLVYGGYMAYEQSVFKSYFTSGMLSQVDFTSSGFEFGLGAYYRIKERFEISLIGNYGQRQTSFSYDLVISENDFFQFYENNTAIPLENLDDPNSCNCFLAENASLDYVTTTIAISLGGSYDLIKKPKYSFGPHLEFSAVASTNFKNNKSTVISFSSELKERFTGSILGMGINFNYQINQRIQLGLAPRYRFQFVQKSSIYAENVRMLFVPIQLKIAL